MCYVRARSQHLKIRDRDHRHSRRRPCHSPDALRDLRPGRDHHRLGARVLHAGGDGPGAGPCARGQTASGRRRVADPDVGETRFAQGQRGRHPDLPPRRDRCGLYGCQSEAQADPAPRCAGRCDRSRGGRKTRHPRLLRAARHTAAHCRARDLAHACAGQASARSRRCGAQGPLGSRPRPPGSQRRLQLGRHPEHRRAVQQDARHHRPGRGRRDHGRHGARFGMRVLYCNRNRLPADQEEKLGVEYAAFTRCSRNPISFRCTQPTFRTIAG